MKLIELKDKIDSCLNQDAHNKDLSVCIPDNTGGIGGTSCTNVEYAHKGFDWDNGKFMLIPKIPMVVMPETFKEDKKMELNKRAKQYEKYKHIRDTFIATKLRLMIQNGGNIEDFIKKLESGNF